MTCNTSVVATVSSYNDFFFPVSVLSDNCPIISNHISP